MPLITIPKLSMAPLWGSIALIGTPVALNTASVALGVGTINKILTNYYGSIAVAGWMTEIRIEDVGWNGIMGIINALIPFLAFNYGRRRFDRMKKGLKSAIILAAIFSMGLEFIICLVPHPFIGLFRPSAEMEKIVLYALRISFFTFPPTIFICVANALFVATGRSTYGLIIQIMRSLVFRIIFIYIFASCLSLYWVWLFQPCAALAGGVFAIPFYLYVLKKVQKELSVQVR